MSTPGQAAAPDDVAAEVVIEALGVSVAIPTDAGDVARLRRQWSRALTHRPADVTIEPTHRSDDEVARDYGITTQVTMAALRETAGRRLNIHAGAVSDDAGRALTVIGASGAGKTTAINHLARRLGYLSDETVSLDDDLVVHPHPKPLSVIADPDFPHVKVSLSPDELGLLEPAGPSRLHRIVLLRRGDDGPARLVALEAPLAIVEIVAQTSSLVLLEHPMDRLARTLAVCGGAWVLHYSEIEDWIGPLVGLLDAAPQPPRAHVHHPSVAPPSATPAHTWQRSAWNDAVQYDDQLVLLVGDTVQLLAGLGAVAWLALASPQTTDALVAHARQELGEHSDAPALVRAALDELAERGIVLAPA